jgi:8-oxo-dGTP pyrophosphatase MutT (NUDIX family)
MSRYGRLPSSLRIDRLVLVHVAVLPELPIAHAATVVVLRDAAAGLEVLMMRRASELAFHGGAWVFPGGRVDPGDVAVEADPSEDGERFTARRAAVREAREEAGLELSPAQLVPLSHWTTPPGRTRRFAAWFFAVALTAPAASAEVVVDGSEIDAHRWLRPEQALRARAAGEFELPPPTFVTLTMLSAFETAAAVLAFSRGREPPIYVPRPREVQDGVLSLYHGDVAYEGGPIDRAGPRHRLHMLRGGWRYECTP